MIWRLICNQCDEEWRMELPELEVSDDHDAECPCCSSDDFEAEIVGA